MMKKLTKVLLSICLSLTMALSLFYTASPPNTAKAAGYGLSNPRTDSDSETTWDCVYSLGKNVKEAGASFRIGGIQSGNAKGAVAKFFPGDWKMSAADYPVEISKSTDPRDGSFAIRLAIGIGRSDLLDNETQWNKYKKNIDSANKNLDAYARQYQAQKKSVVSTSKFSKMPAISVMGYYEQKYDKNGNLVSSTGKIAADADWKASATWSFVTPIGPMYLKLQGGVNVSGKVGPKYDYKQKKWSIIDGSLTLKPNISLEGGYGIDKVATIGAKGAAEVPIQIIPFSKASFNASASVHIYVIFLLNKEYTLAKCSIPLWNTTGKKIGNPSGFYLEPAGDMKILDTSFIKERTAWQGKVKKTTTDGKKKPGKSKADSQNGQDGTILQEGILTTSLPVMKEINGKKVMIFQELDPTRSTLNGSVLKYSVYEAGVWSEPKAIQDDGTSDFYADMEEINGKLVLTWQNEKGQLGSDAGEDAEAALQEMGEKSEIYYAEFDPATNTFVNTRSVTNNTVTDMLPQLAQVSGKTAITWIRNDADSMMQEKGTNDIIIRTKEGSTFSEEKILCRTEKSVSQYVVTDGDVPQAYYVSKEEGTDAVVYNQDGDVISELPGAEDIENHISAIWQEDGKISYLSDGEVYEYDVESGETAACQAGESAIGANAIYCSNGVKAGFVWTEYDSETDTGRIRASMKTEDGYSDPITLSEREGTLYRYISPVLSSDGAWSVLANAEDTDTNLNSLLYIEKESDTKLDLVQARIDEYDRDEDGLTGVNYLVTNTSDTTVDALEMKIELEDGTVLTKQMDVTIFPGESQLGTAYVDLSDIDKKQKVNISIYAQGQKENSQNTVTATIGFADVQVKGTVEETSDLATVTAQLENASDRETAVDLKISEDGNALAENTNLVLAAREIKTVTLTIPKSKIAYSHNDAAYLELKASVTEGDYLEDNNVDYVILYKEKSTGKNLEVKRNVPVNKVTPPVDVSKRSVTKPGKTSIRTAKIKKGKKISLSWKKVKGSAGYQLQYADNKKFKKKKSKLTKKTKYTIKKLKKKKTYYIRIRAYKLDGKKKVYGKWSKVKRVRSTTLFRR